MIICEKLSSENHLVHHMRFVYCGTFKSHENPGLMVLTKMPPLSPHLSPITALISCFILTFAYVGGLYVFRDRRAGHISKDNPKVIQQRLKSVALVCILAPIYVVWVLGLKSDLHLLLLIFGLEPPSTLHSIINLLIFPLLHTMILFLGPLTLAAFEQVLPFQRFFSFKEDVVGVLMSMTGLRNFVFGPLSEEFIFRACMVPLFSFAGFSRLFTIFCLPLYFGLAHIHHAWEVYHQLGATSNALRRAAISSAFQFTYTTLFGWYVTFIFMVTGSIFPPILCHIFCNIMGLPDINEIKQQPAWTQKLIWGAFFFGVGGFFWWWGSLTSSSLFGGSIYWK